MPPSATSGTKRPRLQIDHPREPPEIVYSGGDRPKTASPDRTTQVYRKTPFHAIFLDTSPRYLPKCGVLADRCPLLLHQWPIMWTPIGMRRRKCGRRPQNLPVYRKIGHFCGKSPGKWDVYRTLRPFAQRYLTNCPNCGGNYPQLEG